MHIVYRWSGNTPMNVGNLRDLLIHYGLDHVSYTSTVNSYGFSMYDTDMTDEEFVILKLKDPNFSIYKSL